MAKASDNPFPSLLLVEQASAPATPAAGQVRLYRGTDNNLYQLDETGASSQVGGGSGSGVIAYNAYSPGTLATYSTTATALTDCDATNMAVTFTAPASGKVLVRLSALSIQATNAATSTWGIREGTTTVGSKEITTARAANFELPVSVTFVVTGLTAGSSYTYKWAQATTSGGTSTVFAGGVAGDAVMEVVALP